MSDTSTGSAAPDSPGLDAPAPPGGPQRQDAPATAEQPVEAAPGTPDTGQPGPASDASKPDAASRPVPEPDTESDPETDPDAEGRQAENAGSALDQPSEG